jgi:hypothetical protein
VTLPLTVGGPSVFKITQVTKSQSGSLIWRPDHKTVLQKQVQSNQFATKTQNSHLLTTSFCEKPHICSSFLFKSRFLIFLHSPQISGQKCIGCCTSCKVNFILKASINALCSRQTEGCPTSSFPPSSLLHPLRVPFLFTILVKIRCEVTL